MKICRYGEVKMESVQAQAAYPQNFELHLPTTLEAAWEWLAL
jgi:hypothetical protein